MPWKVKKQGRKYVVVDTAGKVYGTHTTEASALAQLRALYANEKKKKGGK